MHISDFAQKNKEQSPLSYKLCVASCKTVFHLATCGV